VKIEKRLDAMKEVAQLLEQAGAGEDEQAVPLVMQPMMPRPIDNPEMFERFLIDLYLSDEFDKFPMVLQSAVEQVFVIYQAMLAAQKAQEMAMEAGAKDASSSKPGESKPKGEQPNV
jgi:hypothetical protein